MEMQSDTLQAVLSELFALLEAQETNSAALLQLLKDQGIASDEKLSTYLDQAGRASNVKWRAARMRMEYLLTPIQKRRQTKTNPNNRNPKKRNLRKSLTRWKKANVRIKQKTTETKKKKSRPKLNRWQRQRRKISR